MLRDFVAASIRQNCSPKMPPLKRRRASSHKVPFTRQASHYSYSAHQINSWRHLADGRSHRAPSTDAVLADPRLLFRRRSLRVHASPHRKARNDETKRRFGLNDHPREVANRPETDVWSGKKRISNRLRARGAGDRLTPPRLTEDEGAE